MRKLKEEKVAPGVYLVHPAPAIDIRKRGAKAAKWLTRMGAGEVGTQIAPAKGEPPVAVIDASVALAWYRSRRAGRYAARIYARLNDGTLRACAPALWRIVMTSELLAAASSRRLTDAEALAALADAESLPFALYGVRLEADQMFRLGRKYRVNAFQAWHLELARRLGLPIASLDRAVRAAALRNRIPLFEP